MALTNKQLKYYDSEVLRLPMSKRKEYTAQVDRLIVALRKSLADKKEVRITHVLKAGSFAKHTILRRTNEDDVDVDVVFFVDEPNATHETLEEISNWIFELLIDQYPSKSVEDFEIQRKAATVTFVASGLSVDVVPVVVDPDRPGYGWQFDIRDGTKVETCPAGQIKFVFDCKQVDGDFRTLVRLAKRWRTHAELKPLKSFAIELIMARVLDQQGAEGSIDQRFRNFLLYIAQTGLKEVISFPENAQPLGTFNAPVVIVDPVSSTNNVAGRITETERVEIVAAARDAWEAANLASVDDDIAIWKEDVFGPRFRTKEQ